MPQRPENMQVRAALATLYVHAGDQGKAEQTLRQGLEANPDEQAASTLLASFYMQTKQLDRAVTVFLRTTTPSMRRAFPWA